MKKAGFRIILVLTVVLMLAVGAASTIDAAKPVKSISVNILNVDTANYGFQVSYSWDKYTASTYSITVKENIGNGIFQEVAYKAGDLVQRTTYLPGGSEFVPAEPGAVVDPGQSYLVILQLFKNNGSLSAIEINVWPTLQ